MGQTTVVNTTTEKIVTQEGETIATVISEGTRTIYKQEPSFIKLYIQDILYFNDMPKGLTNVMYALISYATFADKGLRVYLPTGLKQELINKLGVTKQGFNNALTKLCKGQIIRRVATGVYELNPYFFGKGEWKDIDKLRAGWGYDKIKGRTFQGVAIHKDDGQVEETSENNEWATEEYLGNFTEKQKRRIDRNGAFLYGKNKNVTRPENASQG